MMPDNVNGLPIGVLVVLGGIGVVCALWLALRFGRAIAIALAGAAILVAILVGTVALAGQSAANYETAKVATKAVAVAQAAQSSNLVLVGAVGCIGGVGLVSILALGVVALVLWYRLQMAETRQARGQGRLPGGRRRQALGDGADVGDVIYIETDEGVDLAGVDLSAWGW